MPHFVSYYTLQSALALVYLSSSDIYALINYTGFGTWVNKEKMEEKFKTLFTEGIGVWRWFLSLSPRIALGI